MHRMWGLAQARPRRECVQGGRALLAWKFDIYWLVRASSLSSIQPHNTGYLTLTHMERCIIHKYAATYWLASYITCIVWLYRMIDIHSKS